MELVFTLCNEHAKRLAQCGSTSEFRIIKGSLQTLIRKWCDEQEIVFVSKRALLESEKLRVDLFKMQWKDQPIFDEGRRIFHLEHKYTVGDMIQDMIKNPSRADSVLQQYQIGWILKSEDKKIKKTGRDDHNKIYKDAKIDLIFKS